MHRIRLREPWTASLTANVTAIVYSRKFHKPTGIEEQPITLKILLLPREPQDYDPPDCREISVVVNGVNAERLDGTHLEQPPSIEAETTRCLFFQLRNLEPFNNLEIGISGSGPTIGKQVPKIDATVIPTFGSFVIESVELQIE